MTIQNRDARALYEIAKDRDGKDRIDVAARLADEIENFARKQAKLRGINLPGDDRCENYVTATFAYIMDAVG